MFKYICVFFFFGFNYTYLLASRGTGVIFPQQLAINQFLQTDSCSLFSEKLLLRQRYFSTSSIQKSAVFNREEMFHCYRPWVYHRSGCLRVFSYNRFQFNLIASISRTEFCQYPNDFGLLNLSGRYWSGRQCCFHVIVPIDCTWFQTFDAIRKTKNKWWLRAFFRVVWIKNFMEVSTTMVLKLILRRATEQLLKFSVLI